MHRYNRKGHKYKWEDSLPFHPRLSERGKCNNSLPSLSCIDAARKFSSKPKQTPVCLGKTRSQCVMRWEKPTLSCCHSCPPTPTAVQQKRARKGYLFSNISSTEKKRGPVGVHFLLSKTCFIQPFESSNTPTSWTLQVLHASKMFLGMAWETNCWLKTVC